MDRDEARTRITDDCAGELSDAERTELARHRQDDPLFAEEEARLREAWSLLGELAPPAAEAPPMDPRLREAIASGLVDETPVAVEKRRRAAQKIVQRAEEDAAFAEALRADPRSAIETLLGRPVPADVTLRIVERDAADEPDEEESGAGLILRLPGRGAEEEKELTMEELDLVAAAGAEEPGVTDEALRRALLELDDFAEE